MVRQFSEFTETMDPDGLHEFGAFDYSDIGQIFWRIDCFDWNYRRISPDPADPDITRRILIIMLAREYRSWCRDFHLYHRVGKSDSRLV